MSPSQLITYLNAITVGDLESIASKIVEAENACREMDQADLADRLVLARQAVERADAKEFRRHLETVIAKLGHLK